MLIEFWESLYGYDKWTPTEATVESSNYSHTDVTGYDRRTVDGTTTTETTRVNNVTTVITWADSSGKLYQSQYTVTEPSPLFGMYGGEKLAIRYNPANPHDFYLRELRQGQLYSVLKMVLYAIVAMAAGVYWFTRHKS